MFHCTETDLEVLRANPRLQNVPSLFPPAVFSDCENSEEACDLIPPEAENNELHTDAVRLTRSLTQDLVRYL